ncbi:peptidyl-prolyl cis-trans isomerase D [Rhodovulum sp. ES.010]|uniref:SurA N-terminal domain-containing protein n=1 Tax=Rhodovulum sp. ES.010 TaxID=1882821 RepID=UPI00092A1E64|nr:SurA N-terminal domain-containing protein [Rhodovulum sp. ES.010]SIO24441.1 peptidyl-prolyl cis-trans isomerase D [Rhodovulum sp. ES.010]
MSKSVGKQASKVAVWVLMGLLILGLGGFGISNFGGSIDAIGEVGDEEISVDAYARALRQELNAQQAATGDAVTFAEAQAAGLVERVRARVIADAALDNEMKRLGISVGDDEVAREVLSVPAFQGPDGEFDRETYRFVLEQNGLTESTFEAQVRADAARSLLQAGVVAGIGPPETYAATLYGFLAERRSASLIRLTAADLDAPMPDPTDAQIAEHYKANPDAYTAPRTRRITYAWLTPDMMLDRIEPDDQMLRELYEQRIDEFVQSERRLVERLVFETEDDAAETMEAIIAGETGFDDAVDARGLTLADVDMGDVTQVDIGGDAGAAVFALTEPGVTGPHLSDLGPAIFRVNAILPAQETSYEEARETLADQAARDRAIRLISERITDFDDRLAAGATLEDLAAETEMELGQIGYTAESASGIAAYAGFREAAEILAEGDFPELLELEEGGVFALRLDEEVPPKLRPLEEVRSQVAEDWRATQTRARLTERAEALQDLLKEGVAMDGLGLPVEHEEALSRGGLTPAPLSEALFALEDAGRTAVVAVGESAWLIRLDAILPPDETEPGAAFLRESLAAQAGQGIAQDLYLYFAEALVNSAGLSLEQAALNAVHAQFR